MKSSSTSHLVRACRTTRAPWPLSAALLAALALVGCGSPPTHTVVYAAPPPAVVVEGPPVVYVAPPPRATVVYVAPPPRSSVVYVRSYRRY